MIVVDRTRSAIEETLCGPGVRFQLVVGLHEDRHPVLAVRDFFK